MRNIDERLRVIEDDIRRIREVLERLVAWYGQAPERLTAEEIGSLLQRLERDAQVVQHDLVRARLRSWRE